MSKIVKMIGTDKEIVNDMFKELRKNGFKARQNWDYVTKVTDEELESNKLVWTEKESKEKGRETYCEGYFQHGALYISHSLSKDDFIRVVEILSKFGLEVKTGDLDTDDWKYRCITLVTQGCKIKDLPWAKKSHEQLHDKEKFKDDREVQEFLELCEHNVNFRDIDRASTLDNRFRWRRKIVKSI